MKKVIFIIPYYGKFPNYFQLFLNSCKKNDYYEWLVITDNEEKYNYPNNVKILKKSFNEIKELFQSKFDFKISLETPYKFCDYRPAYGYIFEDYIKDYEYWGYCDIDLIFGNIDNFLKNILGKYEKIFTNGHLSLYKNSFINNRRFMKEYQGELLYKKYFTSNKNYAFDELWNGSINDIYDKLNIEIYEKKLCADIYPRNVNFRLVLGYSKDYCEEFLEKKKKSIFSYEDGEVIRYYRRKEKKLRKEYLYLHLQKRKMKLDFNPMEEINYIIIPNIFLKLTKEINEIKKSDYYQIDINYIKQFCYGRKEIFFEFLSKILPVKLKMMLKKIKYKLMEMKKRKKR